MRKRKWGWIGHILLKSKTNVTRPKREEKTRETQKQLEGGQQELKYTWIELERAAKDCG